MHIAITTASDSVQILKHAEILYVITQYILQLTSASVFAIFTHEKNQWSHHVLQCTPLTTASQCTCKGNRLHLGYAG